MEKTGSIARLAAALAVLALAGPARAVVGVGVSQVQSPADPASSESVAYAITVVNTGDEVLTDVLLVDTVAPQVTAVTAESSTTFTLAVTQGATGTVYAWSATGISMAGGDSFTFTITGTVGVTCGPAVVAATAWVAASTGVTPAEAASNVASFPMGHSFLVTQGKAVSGGHVWYSIIVANTGTTTVENLCVVDTITTALLVYTTVQPAGFAAPAAIAVPGTGTMFVWSATGISLPPRVSMAFEYGATVMCVPASMTATTVSYVTGGDACSAGSAFSGPEYLPIGADTVFTVTATGWAGDSWAVISWEAEQLEVSGNVVKYNVWRTADGTNYALAGSVGVVAAGVLGQHDTRAFWDKGLANGTGYLYRVQPMTACGASAFSDPVPVTPMTSSALVDSGRSGTIFAQPGDGYAKLSWTNNPFPGPVPNTVEEGVTSFNIWRSTSAAGPFAAIPQSPVVNASFVIDNMLANKQEYWYMVFPCCPERRPSFLSVIPYKPASGHGQPVAHMSPDGPRAVRLTWPPATTGTYPIVGFAIYRSDDGGGTVLRIDGGTVGPGASSFVDLTVPTYGKRYVYIIRPIDSAGNIGDAYPTILIDVVLPTNRTYLNRNRIRPAQGEVLEIIYQVTEPGRTRVSVWTQAGELVAKLLDVDLQGAFTVDTPYNSHDRGVASIRWNGTNDRGEVVGSGVYLVVLEVNRKRDFRTVAVLR